LWPIGSWRKSKKLVRPQSPNAAERIGYTRVSTVAQTLDQQKAALQAAGVTKIFSDVMSGALDDRPGLAELLAYVRPGDSVVVWKLDRLGRNTLHILETVRAFADRGVKLRSSLPGMAEISCSARGYDSGRSTQRNPMWLIPVSTICGRRAAGR